MPVKQCQINDKPGFKWGDEGTCYTYDDAVVGGQIPASPTIGTIVWFQLAAGDTGVQSIQSVTLGTSLVSGSISMLIARPIVTIPGSAANIGVQAMINENPGVKIYNDSCLLHCYLASAVTATTVSGTINVIER